MSIVEFSTPVRSLKIGTANYNEDYILQIIAKYSGWEEISECTYICDSGISELDEERLTSIENNLDCFFDEKPKEFFISDSSSLFTYTYKNESPEASAFWILCQLFNSEIPFLMDNIVFERDQENILEYLVSISKDLGLEPTSS